MILPNLAIKQTSSPAKDPVTLAEAKTFLRVTGSDEDALITSLITASTRKVENYINRFLITQTWDVVMDHIPLLQRDSRDYPGREDWWDGVRELPVSEVRKEPDFIILPRGPIQSIEGFTTYNIDDTGTAFTDFNVDIASDSARVYLKNGKFWPTNLRDRNAIEISVKYGYGDDEADVPSDIITAIKILLSKLYEDRGCGGCDAPNYSPSGKADSMPSSVSCLLDPYTIERLD